MELLARIATAALLLSMAACSYDTDALRMGGKAGAGGAGGGGAPAECDEVAKTGCMMTERCTVCVRPSTSRSQGCAAAGAGAPGTPCTMQSECSSGTVCWNADAGPSFICRRYCNADTDCYAEAPTCRKYMDYECTQMPGVKAQFGLCYAK